jgi:hypothetical protein
MADKKERKIVLPGGNVFSDLLLRVKLILRLMGDNRVSPLLKAMPIGAVLYLVLPDLAPGPIDDAAILWLGAYLFVELCPPDVVQEHMEALRLVAPGELHQAPNGVPPEAPKVVNETPPGPPPAREQVIDADFRDAKEKS